MQHYQLSWEEALHMVQNRRYCISPNGGFLTQIKVRCCTRIRRTNDELRRNMRRFTKLIAPSHRIQTHSQWYPEGKGQMTRMRMMSGTVNSTQIGSRFNQSFRASGETTENEHCFAHYRLRIALNVILMRWKHDPT